jgi:hypothetical protein
LKEFKISPSSIDDYIKALSQMGVSNMVDLRSKATIKEMIVIKEIGQGASGQVYFYDPSMNVITYRFYLMFLPPKELNKFQWSCSWVSFIQSVPHSCSYRVFYFCECVFCIILVTLFIIKPLKKREGKSSVV